jgi:hypothetical protein
MGSWPGGAVRAQPVSWPLTVRQSYRNAQKAKLRTPISYSADATMRQAESAGLSRNRMLREPDRCRISALWRNGSRNWRPPPRPKAASWLFRLGRPAISSPASERSRCGISTTATSLISESAGGSRSTRVDAQVSAVSTTPTSSVIPTIEQQHRQGDLPGELWSWLTQQDCNASVC